MLGRPAVRPVALGLRLPALRPRPTSSAACVYLQDYSLRKHLERWWKAPLLGSERVSVADPAHYSRRFSAAMQALLLEGGSGGGAAPA